MSTWATISSAAIGGLGLTLAVTAIRHARRLARLEQRTGRLEQLHERHPNQEDRSNLPPGSFRPGRGS